MTRRAAIEGVAGTGRERELSRRDTLMSLDLHQARVGAIWTSGSAASNMPAMRFAPPDGRFFERCR